MEKTKKIIWSIFYISLIAPFIFSMFMLCFGVYGLLQTQTWSSRENLFLCGKLSIVSIAFYISYFFSTKKRDVSIKPSIILFFVSIIWTFSAISLFEKFGNSFKILTYYVGIGFIVGSALNIFLNFIELKEDKKIVQPE